VCRDPPAAPLLLGAGVRGPARGDRHDEPFDLERFAAAQERDGSYPRALAELRRGRKSTHWMWFVFPQLVGLGHSDTARYYAIGSLEEAAAYLEHPLLGKRLVECGAIVEAEQRPIEAIFGAVDALKLRSSMTLFLRAAPAGERFQRVLDRHFAGEADARTDTLLAAARSAGTP